MKIAIIGNFLPRHCGIATFTKNLVQSILAAEDIAKEPIEIFVVAMNNNRQVYDYPSIVQFSINQDEKQEYLDAADYINQSGADICILQHEYGIYGGNSGVYILALLEQLAIPFITTLHTVVKHPTFHEKNILKTIGHKSSLVVVMSNLAVEFLVTQYKIPASKIQVVQHGVPDFSEALHNRVINLQKTKKRLLCTFGLLGRSKGIETVLHALPEVVQKFPDIVYVILGKTHPNVKREAGEEYREFLESLVEKYGLQNNVQFINEFLNEEDLENYLLNVDLYITPYLNEAQITSGTLAYAVGSGSCIVSTPYWHARELLAGGRGELFNFGDSKALSAILISLLSNPRKMNSMRVKAFTYGKKMYWKNIGETYFQLLDKVINEPAFLIPANHYSIPVITEPISMDHIERMTDAIGMIEHASFSVPDLKEGYSLDDNTRALLMVMMHYNIEKDKNLLKLADTYLRFIKLMQMDDGFFHNDYDFKQRFMDEKGSEDSFGRTIWAMGYLIQHAPNDAYFQFASNIFYRALPHFEKIISIRAIANIIIGLSHFLTRYPDHESIRQILIKLTKKITDQYNAEKEPDWDWFEPILSYDNAILPLALWNAFAITHYRDILTVAKNTTSFLEKQTMNGGHISIVGSSGWQRKGEAKSIEGQQPINAMALVMMYGKAYELTKDENYFQKMYLSFSWFTGNNDLFIPLFDEETKGCCDGLEKTGINRNQGAESTLSYYLALLTLKINTSVTAGKINSQRLTLLKQPVITSGKNRKPILNTKTASFIGVNI